MKYLHAYMSSILNQGGASRLNSVTETELKPNEDQNNLELGTKPKTTRKLQPNQREGAKQSAYEKSAARERELVNNCVENHWTINGWPHDM
jgi:hypothetical protein